MKNYMTHLDRTTYSESTNIHEVGTLACIGHAAPEALAGGPIGKVLDGDVIQIIIDRKRLDGTIDLVGRRADAYTTWMLSLRQWGTGADN